MNISMQSSARIGTLTALCKQCRCCPYLNKSLYLFVDVLGDLLASTCY